MASCFWPIRLTATWRHCPPVHPLCPMWFCFHFIFNFLPFCWGKGAVATQFIPYLHVDLYLLYHCTQKNTGLHHGELHNFTNLVLPSNYLSTWKWRKWWLNSYSNGSCVIALSISTWKSLIQLDVLLSLTFVSYFPLECPEYGIYYKGLSSFSFHAFTLNNEKTLPSE